MKDTYTEQDGVFDYGGEKFYIVEDFPSVFHVGQSYADKPVKRLICKGCGGDNFNIGQGDYFTAIRCQACKWECCIHEG